MATNTENDVQGSIRERNELSVYFSLNNDVIFKTKLLAQILLPEVYSTQLNQLLLLMLM